METRLSHCLFIIFSDWIWLFIITSILGGTKAEVRCIPSCQQPVIEALSRETSALDLTNFGAAPAEEFLVFLDGFPSADGDEKHNAAELTESEESSFKVHARSEETNASGPQRDALNGHQKLSHPSPSAPRAFAPSPSNVTENSTGDGRNDSLFVENDDMTATGDRNVASWRRSRSARSAETWSGFKTEGVDDASVWDQVEFHLTSSTFALTGDTAHNQAMVHWSGQNSSVSSLL